MVEMADTQENFYNPIEWVPQNIRVGTTVQEQNKSEITQSVCITRQQSMKCPKTIKDKDRKNNNNTKLKDM